MVHQGQKPVQDQRIHDHIHKKGEIGEGGEGGEIGEGGEGGEKKEKKEEN